MRVRRATIVVVIAALVMWTAVSFLMLATIGATVGPMGVFVISHAPCTILMTVPPRPAGC